MNGFAKVTHVRLSTINDALAFRAERGERLPDDEIDVRLEMESGFTRQEQSINPDGLLTNRTTANGEDFLHGYWRNGEIIDLGTGS